MPRLKPGYQSESNRWLRVVTLILSAALIGGCSSMYYGAMEKLGYEKRDILVDRVSETRDAQGEAQKTFRSSLDRFQHVVDTPDTELKERYETLREAYDESKSSAEDVRERIDEVEDVAAALFDEWDDELDKYESDKLRRNSERELKETRQQYSKLIDRMHQAESRMDPVLQAFQDQVLFLKHNLNAQAIGALEGELGGIRQDVDKLIRNMEESIAESDAFIKRFQSGQ